MEGINKLGYDILINIFRCLPIKDRISAERGEYLSIFYFKSLLYLIGIYFSNIL